MSDEAGKSRSLASRKFDFEDMINADPSCPPNALKVVRAYLPFVTDFDGSFSYRSIIDLQVDTGLGPQAIIDTRRKLVELGHFVAEGKTTKGTQKFRLSFARENLVLDHKIIARQTLRRLDAERKEKQRLKRKAAPVTTTIEITDKASVTTMIAGQEPPRAYDDRRDVTTMIAGEYLDKNLDGFGSEQRETHNRSHYASASGDDPDLPYPIPEREDEAVSMLEQLQAGCNLSAGVLKFFRIALMAGKLTPAMIEEQRRVA